MYFKAEGSLFRIRVLSEFEREGLQEQDRWLFNILIFLQQNSRRNVFFSGLLIGTDILKKTQKKLPVLTTKPYDTFRHITQGFKSY